jgi:uncharacterized membrane protein YphA (DoxX/SURF4 family)
VAPGVATGFFAWDRRRECLVFPRFMPTKTPTDFTILAARMALGLWFLVLGVLKVYGGIPEFSRNVASYRILQDPWNMPVAYLVPWLEIVAGLGLVSGWLNRGASRIALVLTLVFIFVSGQAWILGLSGDCGCFGGWFTLNHFQKMLLLIVQLGVVAFVIATEGRQKRGGVFRTSQMRLPG